jgi:hypothetical protein
LSQGDSRWGTNTYDSIAKDIEEKGCAMTSLCMALKHAGITNLTLNGSTVTNTPGTLNDFMVANSCFTSRGNTLWASTVTAASNRRLIWNSVVISSLTSSNEARDYLNSVVCGTGTPVVVGVKLNSDGNPGHYVLVTGKDGEDFLIANPGSSVTNRLSQYQYRYETRGHISKVVATAPAIPQGKAALDVELAGPQGALFVVGCDGVNLLVTDPLGRRAGVELGGTNRVTEIPGSVSFFDALDDDLTGEEDNSGCHSVYVTRPAQGLFQVSGTATTNGPVNIRIVTRSHDGEMSPPVDIQTNLATGMTFEFEISVQTEPPVRHDLAVLSVKAPKKVTLSSVTPTKPGRISITIRNLGEQTEVIDDLAELAGLISVQGVSLGACAPPVLEIVPPKAFPVRLAPKKKLTVRYSTIFGCPNDPLASTKTESHADFQFHVTLNHSALDGQADAQPETDTCPRPPDPLTGDKGCGAKNPDKTLGAPVVTDVVVKE